ncbi:unnamed protein product [Mytilus edulis]|uniref:Uncharacterized protein n=1 Tax=Mytilus edulis TaxID=6550 RepID=A0A8S3PU40_MYTED|nr:unnamed protein product [Mytilus edulis]
MDRTLRQELPDVNPENEYDLVDISIYELSDTADTETINADDTSIQRNSFRNRRSCLWSITFSWIVFPTTAGNLLQDVIGRQHSQDGQISSIVTLKTAVGVLVVLMYIRFSPGRIEGLQLNTESIHTLKVKFKCLHPEMNTVTFVKTPTDTNVHSIIPLAHEYQVDKTLNKADSFLSKKHKDTGFGKCRCQMIVDGIVEAEKYGLTKTLNILIDFASRKKYSVFSKVNGYNEITTQTLFTISMTRWQKDIDAKTGETCSKYYESCVSA